MIIKGYCIQELKSFMLTSWSLGVDLFSPINLKKSAPNKAASINSGLEN